MAKNGCESIKMSEIWEKMRNPMPFGRVMGPNGHIIENYGDLQPIAQSMKPTLWVQGENISFGLLPLCDCCHGKVSAILSLFPSFQMLL